MLKYKVWYNDILLGKYNEESPVLAVCAAIDENKEKYPEMCNAADSLFYTRKTIFNKKSSFGWADIANLVPDFER